MITGLFLNFLDMPEVSSAFMILGAAVLSLGAVYAVFRRICGREGSRISADVIGRISVIACVIFITYIFIELVGACACIAVNEACRNGYHYDFSKTDPSRKICRFCSIFKKAGSHSAASDALTLGIYFDVFIIGAYAGGTVRFIRSKMTKARGNGS